MSVSVNTGRMRLLGVLLLCAACRPASSPPPDTQATVDPTRPTPAEPDDANVASPVQVSPATPIHESPAATLADDDTRETVDLPPASDDASQIDPASSQPASAPVPVRLVLLADAGPLLIDVQIAIDGQPHSQVTDALVSHVVLDADTDGDRRTTWRELTTDPRINYGQYGTEPVRSEDERRARTYRFDANRDEIVQADELLGFLANRAGMQSMFEMVQMPEGQQRMPAFNWLDVDQNHLLDAAEIDHLVKRLRLLDADDDWTVTEDELMQLANIRRSSRGESYVATPRLRRLWRGMDWSRFLFAIEEKYSFGSPIRPEDFPGRVNLVHALDLDADASWNAAEVAGLLAHPVDASITVSLGEPQHLQWITDGTDEIPDVVLVSQDRISVPWAGFDLIAQIATPDNDFTIADDVWDQWDDDDDQSLDESEYAAAESVIGLPWDHADLNRDARLTRDEAFTLVRKRRWAADCRVVLTLARDDRPFWTMLDQNADRRLSQREIMQAANRIRVMTTDDGNVQPADIRPVIRLTFARGDINRDNQPRDEVLQPANDASVVGPSWFQAMDRNGDGWIWRSEFLGEPAMFDSIDQDGDGFINAHEAEVVAEHAATSNDPAE